MKNELQLHRDEMKGHRYYSNMNDHIEYSVVVHNVTPAANGFSVIFRSHTRDHMTFCGLKEFLRRFPHKADK